MIKVSIKAIFLGGLVDVVSSFVLAIPLTLIAASRGPGALKSAGYHSLETAIGLICSVLGGYVAGRIAKRSQLLNGALSSWFCTLLGIWAVASGLDHQPHIMQIFNFLAAPVCAYIGGYLTRPRVNRQCA
jgi:hypothetical protein